MSLAGSGVAVPTSYANPLAVGPVIVVAAVGEAEGSRGSAAALSCAGAVIDTAALLVDVGGRAPRPTLLASTAAQKLEERLTAHLPHLRVAARGQVCHLAVPADPEGLEAASAAVTAGRDATAVLHVPSDLLEEAVEGSSGLRPSGVLLRADLDRDRALVALAARELMTRGLTVAVLKRRLSWMVERRAHFGVLPAGSAGGLPGQLVRRLGVATTDTETVPIPVAAQSRSS
jgi:hypothetical protein